MSEANLPRVPTMRAVDHVAYTVPNLDEAVRFFVDHFGAELIFVDGPFVDADGDGMRRRLNVDPSATCTIAMIRLGAHHNVELFEYHAPEQNPLPRNSDVGGHHMGFYVDDIDAGFEYVKAIPGVTVQEGPNVRDDPGAPVAGQRWFYFQSPWGMQLELTSCAAGGFYDGMLGAGMAAPGETWR